MSESNSTGTRVAIVTGAARGIGAAVAKRLAQDGFAVGVLDLDEAAGKATVEAIEAAGGRALAVGADVSDAEQVEAAVSRVATELGAPTVLVNNAGVIRDNMLFKMTEVDWDVVMNVHLRGAFLMTRAVQKHMIDAKWGRIVSLSSTSALGNRGQANYSTAKAGLQGFTKTLAIELGKFGVTANAIAPGFIQTEMTKATADRMGIAFEDFIAYAAKEIPVQRGRPARGHRAPGLVLRQRGRRFRVRPGRLRRRRPEGLRKDHLPPASHARRGTLRVAVPARHRARAGPCKGHAAPGPGRSNTGRASVRLRAVAWRCVRRCCTNRDTLDPPPA
jgi:3-oxoacyl-[acyl-carrier protein] reductase